VVDDLQLSSAFCATLSPRECRNALEEIESGETGAADDGGAEIPSVKQIALLLESPRTFCVEGERGVDNAQVAVQMCQCEGKRGWVGSEHEGRRARQEVVRYI
jgi:hypothetical protein